MRPCSEPCQARSHSSLGINADVTRSFKPGRLYLPSLLDLAFFLAFKRAASLLDRK